jgi:isoamylase
VLIDPYAKGNTNTLWDRVAACGPDDNVKTSMRSIVIDAASYDWEGDMPIHRPMRDTVIYELHVGSYTKSPTSGVTHPGTFSGLIGKIPYLKRVGHNCGRTHAGNGLRRQGSDARQPGGWKTPNELLGL